MKYLTKRQFQHSPKGTVLAPGLHTVSGVETDISQRESEHEQLATELTPRSLSPCRRSSLELLSQSTSRTVKITSLLYFVQSVHIKNPRGEFLKCFVLQFFTRGNAGSLFAPLKKLPRPARRRRLTARPRSHPGVRPTPSLQTAALQDPPPPEVTVHSRWEAAPSSGNS